MNQFDQLLQAVRQRSVVDLWHLPLDLNWRDPVALGQVKAEVQRTLLAPGDAQDILAQLAKIKNDQQFVAESPALYRGWQEVMDYLSFIALLFLSPTEVERLFKIRLLFAVRKGLNLQDIVYTYLAVLGDDLTNGEQRQLLISALCSNEEYLGQRFGHLVPFGSASQLSPVVKNWLIDYELAEAGKENRGALEQSEYLSKSKNVSALTADEKKLLIKVIKLYDFLRFEPAFLPSLELEVGLRKPSEPTLKPRVVSTTELPLAPLSFVQPTPAVLKSPEPAFFFDLKDEEEVDQFRNSKSEILNPKNLESFLRELAEEVIKDNNFRFKDEVSQRRFVQIFVSFMKDVRDEIEVREVMLKNQDAGGLGLTSDKVEAVIGIFKKIKKDLPDKIKQWSEVSQRPAPVKTVLPEQKVVPLPQVKRQPEPADQEKTATWHQEMLEQIAKMAVTPAPDKKNTINPKMVDIKAPPRVFGPLEELKEMSLLDFRRLASTANEVAVKLLAKIQLIGETGIGRKFQAVRAWQASRVYKMYVNIGRESIEQTKPITEIIIEHQNQGQETLTVAEFEAIVDLNQKLRF
ncbi:MAG: hypothetical protein V1712_01870 [Patescibacteria group bacterium]